MRGLICLVLAALAGCEKAVPNSNSQAENSELAVAKNATPPSPPKLKEATVRVVRPLGKAGEGVDWRLTSVHGDRPNRTATLIDFGNIKEFEQSSKRAWVAYVSESSSRIGENDGSWDSYHLVLSSYDCRSLSFDSVAFGFVSEDGSLSVSDVKKPSARYVVPGTLGMSQLNIACKSNQEKLPRKISGEPLDFLSSSLSPLHWNEFSTSMSRELARKLDKPADAYGYAVRPEEAIAVSKAFEKISAGGGNPAAIDTETERVSLRAAIRGQIANTTSEQNLIYKLGLR